MLTFGAAEQYDTVRTHLNSIFVKTGTTSQVELIRLVASFAPPLRD